MGVKTTLTQVPQGVERAFRRFFEDGPQEMVPLRRGKNLQGIEITARVGQVARASLVSLGKDRCFLQDAYTIALHPEDHARLKPLFPEICNDISTHLEQLKLELKAQTKAAFSVDIIREETVPEPGEPNITCTCKTSEARTTLVMPGKERERGFCFEAEGFEVAFDQWNPLQRVTEMLHQNRMEEARLLLSEQGLDAPSHVLGSLLTTLSYLLEGKVFEALRLLHGSPALAQSEHGHFLKALVYLSGHDVDRASDFLQLGTAERINPMGCLIKSLLARQVGNQKDAQACAQMAVSDELLRDLIDRHLPSLIDAEQHQNPSRYCFSLHEIYLNEYYHVALQMPFGLNPCALEHPESRALEAVHPATARLAFFPKGQALKLVAPDAQVNGRPVSETGLVLEDGDRIRIGSLTLAYSRGSGEGTAHHPSRRDYSQPCHKLRVEGRRESWLIPMDNTLVLGREHHGNNDLAFPDNGRMTGLAHCELHWDHEHFTITDLGSTNGTAKMSRRLEADKPTALNHGDEVRVGDNTFVLWLDTTAHSAAR